MTTDFSIIKTSWQENETSLRRLRTLVFIEEQRVPVELEWDGLDEKATHWLVLDRNNEPAGTARLLDNGHIGRMAILKEKRQQGLGSALLQAILKDAQNSGMQSVFLNAQVAAVPFYEKFGFVAEGDEFDDAGIPHLRMTRTN